MSVWISPGVIAVDADRVGAQLARHRARQAEHAGLGRRVVRAAEDAAAALRRHRRDADDRAALLALHLRNHGLRHQQRAAQAHVEDRVVVGVGDVHRLARLRDAGVVDQHVDAAEGLEHRGDGGVARRLVGDVGHDAEVAIAQLGGGGGGLGARQVEHGHARAVLRHQLGGGESQAVGAGAAGDHGDLVLEQHLDRLLWRVVFGSNRGDAACLQPFEAILEFWWPSSGPRPVGRGLSPEFVHRMVARQPLDDKRYFFSLR